MSAIPELIDQRGALLTVAAQGVREAVRRRVLGVVIALTAAFLILYGVAAHFAFEEVSTVFGSFGASGPDAASRDLIVTGSTLLGLAMFTSLFLAAVLTTFLTLGVVRGDAEVGLLQPLVARPIGRAGIMLARFLAAAAVSAAYVMVVFGLAIVITNAIGGWTPDHPIAACLLLGASVCVLTAISILASVFLSGTAQGIAVMMVFGAGLTAGLLGQIGDALSSPTLVDLGHYVSVALPFELLYQDALYRLTSDTGGIAGIIVELGPFGGAQEAGTPLIVWGIALIGLVLAIAIAGFSRRDL